MMGSTPSHHEPRPGAAAPSDAAGSPLPIGLARPRRLRASGALRGLVRETELAPRSLVLPMFLIDGEDGVSSSEPIDSMPGVERHTIDSACTLIECAMALGVCAFALFPRVPSEKKTGDLCEALDENNLISRAVRTIKARLPEACVITDIALDPYSPDGHDGVVRDGVVLNDETVALLAQMVCLHAACGADVVAPSDMMDGRVGAIRLALDRAGHTDTTIMSYSAKYASAFYGPFRDALGSAPVARPGVPADKRTYQMDPANAREAMLEATLDAAEGADIVMVKPALAYLDVVRRVRDAVQLPVAAYQVSGEYAMLRAASANGWLEYDDCLEESLTAIARAGADVILSYGALDYARRWRERHGLAGG